MDDAGGGGGDPKGAPDRTDERGDRLLHLTRAQFWGCLAIAVAAFFFVTGPIWRHPGDIRVLDHAIGWSYAVIPLLVGACLLASRRWTWRGFFLDSLALSLVKFGLTFGVAAFLWLAVAPPQAAPAHVPPPAGPAEVEAAIVPTVIDPARTGTLRVTVLDADGRPAPGAIAYVAGGLSGYLFAPPAEPVALANGEAGVTPRLAVVMVGQRLAGRSIDGRLHTLRATREGAVLFNVPLLSGGEPTTVRIGGAGDGPGLAAIRCNVHPREASSRLLVLAHPFFGPADPRGSVRLDAVPAGRLRIAAVSEDRSAPEETVELPAGAAVEVRLMLTLAR